MVLGEGDEQPMTIAIRKQAVSAAYSEHEKAMAAKREEEERAAAAKAAEDAAAAAKAQQEKQAAEAAAAAAAEATAKSSALAALSESESAPAAAPAENAAAKAAAAAAEKACKEALASSSASGAGAEEVKSKDVAAAAAAAVPAQGAVTLNLKSNVAGEGTTAISVPSLQTSVLELKEAIAAKMGHAADTQRLIFTGRVLDNANTLATYNIKSGCSLHLVVSKNIGAGRASASSSPASSAAGTAGSASSRCPPAGLVHAVKGGGIELRQILVDAGPKLVVVDWMAPWCGPCRAIGPKIDELAANNADVVFLKVDTEATGENKALAMDARFVGWRWRETGTERQAQGHRH
jgi:thiol-disulfide isomerase/thioredoxin